MKTRMSYFRKIGSCISQALNVILFNGHPDESISARAHRTNSKWEKYIDAMFSDGHCAYAFQTDINHASDLLGLRSK